MTHEERETIVQYRITKARETFTEVDTLIKNEFWNTAVNRIYYACFYAVNALLLRNSITTQSHAGTRQMFGLHFVKPNVISKESGKFYTDIFDLRQTGDYDDLFILIKLLCLT